MDIVYGLCGLVLPTSLLLESQFVCPHLAPETVLLCFHKLLCHSCFNECCCLNTVALILAVLDQTILLSFI